MSVMTTETIGANARITETVTAWPDVTAGTGRRGEWAFKVGRREIGHLHGNRIAHFGFPRTVWEELYAAGRIDYHSVFPGKRGPAARAITSDADVEDVIALLRVNYERVVAADAARAAAG